MRALSRFACTDDPSGLVGEALSMGDDFPGPAEDLFAAWALQLDEGVDPAAAAGRLVGRYEPTLPAPGSAAERLLDLLREAAVQPPGRPLRRGGRRGRRPA